jgi:hypothetical protein
MEETKEDQTVLPPAIKIQERRSSNIRSNDPDDPTNVASILNSFNTTFLAEAPYQTMTTFLQKYPDSTGARFIHFLQAELYGRPEWEPHRQSFCERTLPLCIGGYHNSNTKNSLSSSNRFSTSLERIFSYFNDRENDTFLPLLLPPTDSTTVHRVRHFRDTEHVIVNLGTNKACLPLMLAAASIDFEKGMVVELGPFAGFSSKCAAYGILAARQNATHQKEDTTPRLVSFDTFEGKVNYDALARKVPWVKEMYPGFTKEHSNFVQLWKDTVQDVYPQAKAISGHINDTIIKDEISKLSQLKPEVFIVDTVKTSKLLHEHLGGLTIRAGTILFLMDFQRSKDLVQQVYGCIRPQYLLPVYISWNNEHMAFVVTQTFTVNDPDIFQCYQKLAKVDFRTTPYHTHVMKARLKQDLVFLSGLTTDAETHEQFREGLRDKTMQAMNKALDEQDEWTWRVLSGLGDRS